MSDTGGDGEFADVGRMGAECCNKDIEDSLPDVRCCEVAVRGDCNEGEDEDEAAVGIERED
jgi:hypothetical protein